MEGNLSRMILASVNGEQIRGRTSANLKDGDRVNLMSPISGG